MATSSSLCNPGLPARSLFREKVAIGTFLQNWVLKGSLLWVKSPYFTISYENNAYFLGKSFQFLLLLYLLLSILKPEAQIKRQSFEYQQAILQSISSTLQSKLSMHSFYFLFSLIFCEVPICAKIGL